MLYEFKRCLAWANIIVSSECSKCKVEMSSNILSFKSLKINCLLKYLKII